MQETDLSVASKLGGHGQGVFSGPFVGIQLAFKAYCSGYAASLFSGDRLIR